MKRAGKLLTSSGYLYGPTEDLASGVLGHTGVFSRVLSLVGDVHSQTTVCHCITSVRLPSYRYLISFPEVFKPLQKKREKKRLWIDTAF